MAMMFCTARTPHTRADEPSSSPIPTSDQVLAVSIQGVRVSSVSGWAVYISAISTAVATPIGSSQAKLLGWLIARRNML